ncbi:TPA: elongation factor G [bacterium]|nr:elongation factor G [bacterium]
MAQAQNLRNVLVVGHGSCGKTTLCEAILYNARAISRMGRVEEGTTVSDYGQDEIKRGISISLSVLTCEYQGVRVNILDTPGYQDFVGEAKEALAAVDAGIVVVDAVHGVEVGTEVMWGYVNERSLPRMIFINMMDKENADFDRTLKSLRDDLGISPTPLQLPIGQAAAFKGVVDLLKMKAVVFKDGVASEEEIPEELSQEATRFHERLIEDIAEVDDALTERYLENGSLTPEEIKTGLCQGINASKIIPVLVGSAEKNVGILCLLEAIIALLPSPIQRAPILAFNPTTKEAQEVIPKEEAPFAAQVFKVTVDPFVGELALFRVYAGRLKPGDTIYNSTQGRSERIGHICFLHGKERKDVPSVSCGDIAAFVKLKGIRISDSLCDPSQPICFKEIEFPSPLTSLAISPQTKADQEKLSTALHRLSEEDSTFKVRLDQELGQTLIFGMGEVHLEMMVGRLISKFGVEVKLEEPKIPYREAITVKAKGEGKHKKQTGGRGQYGHCFLEIEPLPTGSGFEFENKIFGGAIPSKYVPAIEKGVKETMTKGILAGYPVVDTKVTVYDGTFHEVDSSDIAFQLAGSFAFKKAFENARPVLLEPIMKVEVIASESDMGNVIGDLNSKRGKIQGVEPKGKNQIVRSLVPQAEMHKYSSTLNSLTGGRGTYSMTFSHYEVVPSHLAEAIIAQSKAE